jgi:hypothetical protein
MRQQTYKRTDKFYAMMLEIMNEIMDGATRLETVYIGPEFEIYAAIYTDNEGNSQTACSRYRLISDAERKVEFID